MLFISKRAAHGWSYGTIHTLSTVNDSAIPESPGRPGLSGWVPTSYLQDVDEAHALARSIISACKNPDRSGHPPDPGVLEDHLSPHAAWFTSGAALGTRDNNDDNNGDNGDVVPTRAAVAALDTVGGAVHMPPFVLSVPGDALSSLTVVCIEAFHTAPFSTTLGAYGLELAFPELAVIYITPNALYDFHRSVLVHIDSLRLCQGMLEQRGRRPGIGDLVVAMATGSMTRPLVWCAVPLTNVTCLGTQVNVRLGVGACVAVCRRVLPPKLNFLSGTGQINAESSGSLYRSLVTRPPAPFVFLSYCSTLDSLNTETNFTNNILPYVSRISTALTAHGHHVYHSASQSTTLSPATIAGITGASVVLVLLSAHYDHPASLGSRELEYALVKRKVIVGLQADPHRNMQAGTFGHFLGKFKYYDIMAPSSIDRLCSDLAAFVVGSRSTC